MAQAAGLIIAAIGAAVSAYGAVQQSRATEATYKAQAKADETNSIIQAQNAQAAQAQATAREEQRRRVARQVLGEQRAAIAEAGGLGGGTYVGVVEQSAANAELDALNERYAGVMEGRGLITASNDSQFRARAGRMNASSARTAGNIGAASSIIGGASNYYSQRYYAGLNKGGG